MKSITVLMDEHQLILRALKVARNMAQTFTSSGEIQTNDLQDLLNFVVDYSDKFHHLKEENVLFKWMAERGFSEQSGPLGCMLSEHSSGREIINNLNDVLQSRYETDPTAKINDVAQLLNQFASHLEEHISKEDNVLYPMATSLASDGDDDNLLRRYNDFADADTISQTNTKYTALVNQLERKYC